MLLDLNDPNRMGLLSLGLRLMSTPGKFGQALGQSGLGALGDMQQIRAQNDASKDRDMRRKLLEQQQMMADLQLAQARQAQEKRAAIEGAYQGAMVSPAQQALAGGGGPTIANAQAMQGMVPKIDQNKLIQGLMQADPMTAYQMMQPKPSDYKVVGGSLVKIGGDGNVSEAYRAPKEVNMNDLMIPDGKGGFTVNTQLLDAKQRIAAAGAARTNINTPFENAFSKESAKSFAQQFDQINTAGMDASRNLANIDRMEALLSGTSGGALAPTAAKIASLGETFGIKIDPRLGDKEAAEALAVEMALAQRPPGSGPMTDKDFANFLLTVPGLAKTPEGRSQINATLRAKAERDMKMAALAQDYVAKNGVLDVGFYKVAQDFIRANPVVRAQSGAADVRSQADSILRGGR